MPISAGSHLGPYEILAPVGTGGMGEVWKARDPRLDRTVAIKISKEEFSERFEREARAIGALNHPNICQIYDVGPNYLVMEFIEGSTLKGPLPLDLALKYAAQICDALDAAHRKGITHRDLKPANILVTKSGVKLLDFGLAKMASPAEQMSDATVTMALTGKNEIVGTLYYMSPEQLQAQATGKEVDSRSDIFSFGLVLYEMLTGKRAMEGASPASVIAAIMERPAPSVANVAPPTLDRVLKRCLEKDPDARWQSAQDLRAALELAGSPAPEVVASAPAVRSRSGPLPWAVSAVLFSALAVLGWMYFYREPPAAEAVRFQILPPVNYGLADVPVVSPDGRQVAFIATDQNNRRVIWVRPLASLEAKQVTSPSENDVSMPFWSPDSRDLAYAADGKLKKLVLESGAPQVLCDSPGGVITGGAWLPKGVIVFGSGQSSSTVAWKVSDSGGIPVALPLRKAEVGEVSFAFGFSALPDGEHFLYVRYTDTINGSTAVYVGSISGGAVQQQPPLLVAASQAVFAPSPQDRDQGHILFLRNDALYAQKFDAKKAVLTGEAIPIESHVGTGVGRGEGGGNIGGFFSASSTGVLLFRPGSTSRRELTWLDRKGNRGEVVDASGLSEIDLSPDGKRLAAVRDGDIWIVDLERKVTSRFTLDGTGNRSPVWSRDGSRIAFTSDSGSIFVKPAGGGPQELLYQPDQQSYQQASPNDFGLADGSLVFTAIGKVAGNVASLPLASGTRVDVLSLPLASGFKPNPPVRGVAQTQFAEGQARVSPDGRWVAYVSLESGRNETYLRPLPEGDAKILVSRGIGVEVRWRRDGRELYYRSGNRMMAVEIEPGATPRLSEPKELFKAPLVGAGAFNRNPSYVVSADGQKFLAVLAPADSVSDAINVVMNWQASSKN